ncbi:hypothetical protein NDU88_005977 [Pleurodeles waltl]|uniref:Uncharacterized protein n=1 Tax=Pleurodeles waltl TaxID=8319 RepID=A0AAV7QKN9_PLEWA|nr:hypothetical protein NDU88_005977 [Pleurodeles waltl]
MMVPQVKDLTQKISAMEQEVSQLANRLEDAESRAQCHNMRLVQVPEKVESPSLGLHVEDWLGGNVLQSKPSHFFSVEWALRILGLLPGLYELDNRSIN